MAAGCDRADVPDHGLAEVKVSGADEQQPPPTIFLTDLVDHLIGDITGDEPGEGSGVGERVAGEDRDSRALDRDIVLVNGGIDRLQLLVVGAAQKGERRDQRAG